MRSADVRRQFIDFFRSRHGHEFVPSSPVVPHDDPTLLFANAGMNQFKPLFLGTERRHYTRAVNTQKCIRAGGKHNDLDDVGRDTYHHTFFEMLGNWSFGDYFKAEAVAWAWELLVDVWKLDPERLHATYFEGDASEGLEPDTEARDLWRRFLPSERVHPGNKKDNFWEMGEVGPCGPCSEIHFDRTPGKSGAGLVNGDSDQVIEIWNLVFIQFNRTPSGLRPLPARHVDTGMGFERIVAVLQGKASNYDTDVFTPLLDAIAAVSGKCYGGSLTDPVDVALRAVADHVRMATFAIADGARPGPNKADSVLRSVIRRASRYGYTTLDLKEPFLHKLVPTVVGQMGEAFPELHERPGQVAKIVADEEADFLKVIDRGLGLFKEAAGRARARGNVFAGKDVFELHTTFGFPPDMTMQLARDAGFTPDADDYHERFRQFQDKSRGEKAAAAVAVDFGDLPDTDDDGKYDCLNASAAVLGFVEGEAVRRDGDLGEGAEAAVLVDQTCFYAEQGGQVGDTGSLRGPAGIFEVTQTRRVGGRVLHVGRVTTGRLRVGEQVDMHVNNRRRPIAANHTATHLMNLALRLVLGDHVEQRGSLVDDTKTRFDFVHPVPVDAEQLVKIERIVNALVCDNLEVRAELVPLADAKKLQGARAVFGEKYPDPVRVIYVSPVDLADTDGSQYSLEFCGGTHARRTGDLGTFKVVAEESVSKGVRRLTAVTGEEALAHVQRLERDLRDVAQTLGVPASQAAARVTALRDEARTLKRQAASGPATGATAEPASTLAERLASKAESVGEVRIVVADVPSAGDDYLRSVVDAVRSRGGATGVLLASVTGDKIAFVAACTPDAVARGLKAGDWIRAAAKAAGGGGGGRPDMAQAGGKDASKLQEALDAASRTAARLVGA